MAGAFALAYSEINNRKQQEQRNKTTGKEVLK